MDEGPRAEREHALLRRQEADPRGEPEHDLRRGPLPEHLGVLGTRDRDVPDPRGHLHPGLPLLLRPLRQAGASAGSARAAAPREHGRADGAPARRRDLRRPRRRPRPRRGALRGDDPRPEGEAAPGDGRDPHAGLPRRRGGRAADDPRGATRGLQPQHRDRAAPARPHARGEGFVRQGALAPAAREGARRLPRADQVGDHRRPRGDERRGRRHAARPARPRRRRRHDRPVPPALGEARDRSTAGCTPTSSAGSASRARRSASAPSSRGRSSARAIAPTSSATQPRPAAAQSLTRKERGPPSGRPSLPLRQARASRRHPLGTA